MFIDSQYVQPQFLYEANGDGGGGDVGQGGGEGGTDGLFDLSSVPEDYRPYVEPHLKDIQRNVNQKFQDNANYRKQWEPYESLGINDYDPEDLQGLLQFAEIANNPETFKEWWNTVGQENKYFDELDDGSEELDGEESGMDMEALKSTFEQMLDAKLTPIANQTAQFEEAQRVQQAEQHIDGEIAALKEQHGEFDEQVVYKLAMAYDGPDAIQNGYKDYQGIIAGAERDTVNRNQGGITPEGAGAANTNGKPITSFSEASDLARERMSQANRQ